MSGWGIPDFLFAADEIDDLTLSQACETIEHGNYAVVQEMFVSIPPGSLSGS
jgi:hypothetical protein